MYFTVTVREERGKKQMEAAQGRKHLFWFTVHLDRLQGGTNLKQRVTLQKAKRSGFMMLPKFVSYMYGPRSGILTVNRKFYPL